DLVGVALGLPPELLLQEGGAELALAGPGGERGADQGGDSGRRRRRPGFRLGLGFRLRSLVSGRSQGHRLLLELVHELVDLRAGPVQLASQPEVLLPQRLDLRRILDGVDVAPLFHRDTFRYGGPFYHAPAGRREAMSRYL